MERILFKDVEPAEEVYTWGHPLGEHTLYFSKGYVMNVGNHISSSIITLPEDSGSPMFSSDGAFVGLIYGAKGAFNNMPVTTTIKSSTIRQFVDW